ncbi:uracil-DNA glycosylase, family 4 [Natronoarchaeum philippinense]|uniref:Uracil-DNA glycosylase, family 4 n=1 Tax=Natronoarchaeum philippinense TaxID=558529 RepID=A0A285N942_NATPI|nr:uracil-DNA glycosylase family protein [Natronoarchaeum philippinense]SNZ04221.1 uracil-DNA glycosylase, family 4 [Natronoarchaeum philippinense]
MDANQEELSNPFGMDEDCRNCPELCETRSSIAHGYGDVGADFLFVGEMPGPGADETGVPFTGDDAGRQLLEILRRLGLCGSPADSEDPELGNAFLTYLTRCRHPDRAPTDEEIGNCEPYLNAEIRMINPEILVPIGERALEAIGTEYTTTPADELDIVEDHGERIRGRGFELVPMIAPEEQTDAQTQAFVESFAELMATDYRQTKGRRGR